MLQNNPKLILAPMAGWTDLPFRLVCKQLGADVLYSEMISATGIFYNPEKSLALAKTCFSDAPMILQLFGNNPEHFAHAAKIISNLPDASESDEIGLFRPAGIDINFGCPAPKVFRQESGCFLMKHSQIARNIILATERNTSLPISIKIRAGIEGIDAIKFLENLANLNWKTVIVHGRTYKGGFSGPIDFELIKKIKELFPEKEVIANGGIMKPEDAKNMLEKTNADGLAIARGCWGNPWIFKQIKDYLKTNSYSHPTLEEKRSIILKQAHFMEKAQIHNGVAEFRKHLLSYFKGEPNAKEIRTKLMKVETKQEIEEVLGSIG